MSEPQERIICHMCSGPVQFEFERFKDDSGETVHQVCYENKLIEAAIKSPFRKAS